jgi:type IV pilus assembly protein PilM
MSGTRREEGAVLLLALVLIVVSISTVYAMAKTVTIELLGSRQRQEQARAQLAAASGVAIATRALLDDLRSEDPVQQAVDSGLDAWALLGAQPLALGDGGELHVRVRDAGSRIGLNGVVGGAAVVTGDTSARAEQARAFLVAALETIVANTPELARTRLANDEVRGDLADAIIDWIDADEETRIGLPEASRYEKADGSPLDRPIFSLDELAPVPGMDPLLLEALKAYFSPYPLFPTQENSGGLNPNTAPLAAVHGHGVRDAADQGGRRVPPAQGARRGRRLLPAAGSRALPGPGAGAAPGRQPPGLPAPGLPFVDLPHRRRGALSQRARLHPLRRRPHARRGAGDALPGAGLLMFEQTVLGMDLGSYSVKFAELRAGLRGVEFLRFEELVLPPAASSEEIEATIQLFVEQRGLDLSNIVTALETRYLTQRHLRFPFGGRKRVAAAVGFEIEEELPVPLRSVIAAHDMVALRENQTDVLVLIAARTDLERFLESMHRMEFEPRIIEAEGAALANLSRYFKLDDLSRVIIDVGHHKTNVSLLVDGHAVSLRRIPLGGHQLTEALAHELGCSYEEAAQRKHAEGVFEPGSTKPVSAGVRDVLERLGREVQRTVQAIVPDPADPVAPVDIVLVGGSAQLTGLREFLTERTGLAVRGLALPPELRSSHVLSSADLPAYAQAAALALRASRTERVTSVDFRQEEFAVTPDLSALRGQLELTFALFGLLLVLWMAGSGVRALVADYAVTARERELRSIYSQLYPDAPVASEPLAAIESKARETRELAGHLGVLGNASSALEVLREIALRKPEDLKVTLEDLRISARNVSARGHSPDIASIERLKGELSKVPAFESVQITNVGTDPGSGRLKSFSLDVRLREGP